MIDEFSNAQVMASEAEASFALNDQNALMACLLISSR